VIYTLKSKIGKLSWVMKIRYFIQAIKNCGIGIITKKPNPKEIPIIINNRNRYSFLKQLVDSLIQRGYSNLIILDNDSTYGPLLEYYRHCQAKVIYLHQNLGYMALSKLDLFKEIRKGFYVYTDPDVVPIDDCPENFMEIFLSLLKKHPSLTKVGFSLGIRDIPDCYEKKQEVISHEERFWKKKIEDNVYEAKIDTTLALHRPYSKISLYKARMARVGYPYELKHLPWYLDSNNLPEEELYYVKNATIGGHWTNGDPQFNADED